MCRVGQHITERCHAHVEFACTCDCLLLMWFTSICILGGRRASFLLSMLDCPLSTCFLILLTSCAAISVATRRSMGKRRYNTPSTSSNAVCLPCSRQYCTGRRSIARAL